VTAGPAREKYVGKDDIDKEKCLNVRQTVLVVDEAHGNSLLFSGGSRGVARFTRMRSALLKGYGLALACADSAELSLVKVDTTKTIEKSVCSNPS